MRIISKWSVAATLITLCATDVLAQNSEQDLDALRTEVAALRGEYEARLAELERRLQVAEQNARQANQPAQVPAAASSTSQSAFNPGYWCDLQRQRLESQQESRWQ